MEFFLILNYNNTNLINNLIKNIDEKISEKIIVIVDNGSDVNKYNMLNQLKREDIFIIRSEKNLGFGKGNNVGYKYILDNFTNINNIHCINSDIEIINDDFFNIINKYENDYFVLGPNVLTNGFKSSPLYIRNNLTLLNDIKKEKKIMLNKKLKHQMLSKFKKFYDQKIDYTKHLINQDNGMEDINLKENEYYVLNGCYLIFTKKYINKFNYLFDENTFLYYEEDFLFKRLYDNKCSVKYIKEITINHLEGGSTKKDLVKKYHHMYDSLKEFERVLND